MPVKIAEHVAQADIDRIINWCHEGQESGSRVPGMSYEEGVMATLDWLTGHVDEAPDQD